MTMSSFAAPHDAARFGDGGERCPLCDQPVANEKLAEIAARQDRARSEIAGRLEAEFAARAKLEREGLVREAAVKETAARAEGQKAAEERLHVKLAEIEAAKAAAEQTILELQAAQQAAMEQRLAEERVKIETAKDAEINAVRLKAMEDKLKIEQQVQDLQRKLQNKTAEELGEGPEFDLFEDLKRAFVEDRISRVEKGVAGPDIFHDVYYNGKFCGRIVYDAKNRNAWRNDYVAKLRQDQIAAEAGHAVLASRVFPSNARELHVQDGVIVAHPARVIVLAELLRKHIVQTHALRLSNEARASKTAALYEFVGSEPCRQMFESLTKQSSDMLDLEMSEKKSHEKTWRERDRLIRALQRTQGQLTSEIERILGTGAGEI